MFSILTNLGQTNLSGYLLMQIQKNYPDSWELVSTQINESKFLKPGSHLNLSSEWNSNPWNTNNEGNGYYRIFTSLTDPQSKTLINDTQGNISNSYEFYLDKKAPSWGGIFANETTPSPGDYVTFSCNWTDNYQLRDWIFSWNLTSTGNWVNVSFGDFSGTFSWSNTSLKIPDIPAGRYGYKFYARDRAGNENSTDSSIIIIPGYLEAYLELPPLIPGKGNASQNGGYKVGQKRKFIIKANVTCKNTSSCGNVQGTIRYNLTSEDPDTAINTSSDTPFYILDPIALNPKSCENNPLEENETCFLNWTINSTGALKSKWKLDVLFESAYTHPNSTQAIQIEITKVLIMSLSWNEISFGVVEPLTTGNPALLNDQLGYNISINENSNDVDDLWIRGTDLLPETVTELNSIIYKIGVGNITWNDDENNYNSINTTRLSKNYALMRSSIPSGTVISTYYWICLLYTSPSPRD